MKNFDEHDQKSMMNTITAMMNSEGGHGGKGEGQLLVKCHNITFNFISI